MTIHPTAIVEDGAQVDPSAQIGPYAHVGPHATIGADVTLHAHTVVMGHTSIGARTAVFPFAVLGAPPQHLGYKDEPTTLVIGEGNLIREHVTMHPGTVQGHKTTVVGDNCLFMVGAHVAHDCTVGNNVIFANNATLGGHITIGDFVFLGGLCAIHQYCRVGPYSFLGGGGILTTDVIPYGSAFGNHAKLEGLNIVGMKRRGMSRETIHKIRAAYRMLFAEEGTLKERLEDATEIFKDTAEVMTIIDFMRADADRPLCLPAK
ncbi:acyl-ACP--UDP-N-acetylglucosamine O-acyltransferase [Parvularcula sp. LCG005]|uniref:acyl-ACP--UDP-N-acetylglucosamine O-acyltransferase n=1 Tax=Parvularcula sp. LCG005 TaxID=3078805 RepID=UPI002943A158|nr:acyl-ACP--UDP-N-acetylglucosamine O-acyltransferase [Parvularcula sp. LCG005]WOI52753.1 acyl-ACP--UDP-N-acetylglucosamine O-acyltransferase [Parvularcula sp. LCG005]